MYKITELNLKWAYKKLKNYIYFYNSSSYLKDKIIKFEESYCDASFTNMSLLLNRLISSKLEDIEFSKDYYDNIKFIAYPKKDRIYLNSNNSIELDDYNIFIDMPLELYLVDVLFVLDFLNVTSKDDYKYSYGNSFNFQLFNMLESDRITNNLLLTPHNRAYNAWRNSYYQGINDKKDNKILIKFDFEKCFYNIYFEFDVFCKKIFGDSISNDPIFVIMSNVYYGFEKLLQEKHIFKKAIFDNKVHLPVGLISSHIILNNMLKSFDTLMSSKCLSYARYVDDVILVIDIDNPNASTLLDVFPGVFKC